MDGEVATGNEHFAALILARGGSKGIKLKNIRQLAGQPLLSWVVQAAIDSGVFDSVWVSTDHDDIARVAGEWGAKVFRRGAWNARDQSSSSESIKEFLDAHAEVDMVAHIQCTSPCLHPHHFIKPVEMVRSGEYDSVFAVSRRHFFRWKEVASGDPMTKVETIPENFDPAERPVRTDWKGELYETGAFYITNRRAFMEAGCTQGGRTKYFEIEPKYSVDIDTDIDWLLAEERVLKFGYFGRVQPRGIKLTVLRMEGVLLSDQYLSIAGYDSRSYNAGDSLGVKSLKGDGVEVRVISESIDPVYKLICNKLGVILAVEPHDTFSVVDKWRMELGLDWGEVSFIGREESDIKCLKQCVISGAPSDSSQEANRVAKFVAKQRGGRGAVREFCDYVMLVNNKARSISVQCQDQE